MALIISSNGNEVALETPVTRPARVAEIAEPLSQSDKANSAVVQRIDAAQEGALSSFSGQDTRNARQSDAVQEVLAPAAAPTGSASVGPGGIDVSSPAAAPVDAGSKGYNLSGYQGPPAPGMAVGRLAPAPSGPPFQVRLPWLRAPNPLAVFLTTLLYPTALGYEDVASNWEVMKDNARRALRIAAGRELSEGDILKTVNRAEVDRRDTRPGRETVVNVRFQDGRAIENAQEPFVAPAAFAEFALNQELQREFKQGRTAPFGGLSDLLRASENTPGRGVGLSRLSVTVEARRDGMLRVSIRSGAVPASAAAVAAPQFDTKVAYRQALMVINRSYGEVDEVRELVSAVLSNVYIDGVSALSMLGHEPAAVVRALATGRADVDMVGVVSALAWESVEDAMIGWSQGTIRDALLASGIDVPPTLVAKIGRVLNTSDFSAYLKNNATKRNVENGLRDALSEVLGR